MEGGNNGGRLSLHRQQCKQALSEHQGVYRSEDASWHSIVLIVADRDKSRVALQEMCPTCLVRVLLTVDCQANNCFVSDSSAPWLYAAGV